MAASAARAQISVQPPPNRVLRVSMAVIYGGRHQHGGHRRRRVANTRWPRMQNNVASAQRPCRHSNMRRDIPPRASSSEAGGGFSVPPRHRQKHRRARPGAAHSLPTSTAARRFGGRSSVSTLKAPAPAGQQTRARAGQRERLGHGIFSQQDVGNAPR